jgi:hypothetical protein
MKNERTKSMDGMGKTKSNDSVFVDNGQSTTVSTSICSFTCMYLYDYVWICIYISI